MKKRCFYIFCFWCFKLCEYQLISMIYIYIILNKEIYIHICAKNRALHLFPLWNPPFNHQQKKHQLSWPARRGWKRLEPMALSVSNRPASQQVCQPSGWWSLLGTLWLKDLQFFATKYRPQRRKNMHFLPAFSNIESGVSTVYSASTCFFSPFRPTCNFGPTNAGHTGVSRLVCLAVVCNAENLMGVFQNFNPTWKPKIVLPRKTPLNCEPMLRAQSASWRPRMVVFFGGGGREVNKLFLVSKVEKTHNLMWYHCNFFDSFLEILRFQFPQSSKRFFPWPAFTQKTPFRTRVRIGKAPKGGSITRIHLQKAEDVVGVVIGRGFTNNRMASDIVYSIVQRNLGPAKKAKDFTQPNKNYQM